MTEPVTYDDLPRQTSTVERGVTALLMVGLAVLVPVASFLGLFFAMVSDGCTGDTECNGGQIGLGVLVAAGSPVVVFVVALVVVIVRIVRRLPAWWVPLVALVAGAALWGLGAVIAASAVG
ncbi:hypothetical protein [Nocardioides sp. Soil805]|uniref:hypothetical protein n=1 Tax=Nocardioides sp. Soil805 TaxID=1736416 RepID=UPI000702A638|nr:hypothetical protein [Nocardioides sp. Soil805]KRF36470.1 hypothetical protein ASG94_03185 [Nocardioides sp. Soil805]